ncbi:thiol-disulfide oxidoreductase DCC family protein [Paenibacillus dokdonensis]|uniref:Thiol-disulfide oxidoreductase DCC family protein n=1 Tax=Paenibacillus dokdonensis TaxID=2567944 RepID=A0ABU6GI16_9BACL|nr:thiol-disulfide oxidoreductase DCC family protein [Paenibacillus dokdonensis]MEC0239405.1 thiol-disulfide oxidoreductase DCC family protein [Paenibacillus dokdonensis]
MNDKQGPEGNGYQGIVLVDGVCHLCQGLTRFIIERDPLAKFQFASLQSDIGAELLQKGGLPVDEVDTVVVIENGKYYIRSAAVLRIVRQLKMPWPLLYAFAFVPLPVRDWLYRYVARNRYRWFGKEEQCMLPTPELRKRFLS